MLFHSLVFSCFFVCIEYLGMGWFLYQFTCCSHPHKDVPLPVVEIWRGRIVVESCKAGMVWGGTIKL